MPEHPDIEYCDSWVSWDDFLGVPLPFEEAQLVASSLKVSSQEMWWAFSREKATLLLRLRIPSRPHIYYNSQWKGYSHWLGLSDEPLALPRISSGQWGYDDWAHCQYEDCAVDAEDEDCC